MGESAAGSVLVRGLLHANSHPKPHTFYHMKAPAWWAARRAMLANLDTLHDILWCSRWAQIDALLFVCCFGGPASVTVQLKFIALLVTTSRCRPGGQPDMPCWPVWTYFTTTSAPDGPIWLSAEIWIPAVCSMLDLALFVML